MRLPSPGPEAGKKAPWERGRENEAGLMVAFDDNRLASVLFGRYGENLALIERRLGVTIDQRGNHVSIDGPRDAFPLSETERRAHTAPGSVLISLRRNMGG